MEKIIRRLQEEVRWLLKNKEGFELKPYYFKGYIAGMRMAVNISKIIYKNYKENL
jgi:hypothetical protein